MHDFNPLSVVISCEPTVNAKNKQTRQCKVFYCMIMSVGFLSQRQRLEIASPWGKVRISLQVYDNYCCKVSFVITHHTPSVKDYTGFCHGYKVSTGYPVVSCRVEICCLSLLKSQRCNVQLVFQFGNFFVFDYFYFLCFYLFVFIPFIQFTFSEFGH